MPKGVYKKTDEQKRKISETLKRNGIRPPSRKGTKWTEKDKTNHLKGLVGKDMSWWKKGRKFTEEHKKNMSKAHKWIVTWNKGIPHTIEWRRKQSELKKGSGGSGWKGGINDVNDLIRKSLDYRLWREAVFKRDNYTCQKTKVRGKYMIAHHIESFNKNKELRFTINNGITFTKEVHSQFHHLYGNRNNNRLQLEEFLKV